MLKKISLPIFLLIVISVNLYAQNETIYPEGLKTGDVAPDFTGKDQYGKTVTLGGLLKSGPVVILFYRGQWCPYCNKQLARFADSLQLIKDRGTTVLAVAAETTDNISKSIEKAKISFPVIADEGMRIMRLYKVNFSVDEKTIARYKNYGIDFDKVNGSNGANLPVPATYIIGTNGTIKYVFFDTDYRKRASVKDILENL